MSRLIRAKAPLRVSFAGGGTDVPPFPAREGGVVLSATINRYAYGALAPREDDTIGVESVDYGVSVDYDGEDDLAFDGKLDLVKAAIHKLGRGGYDLFLHSNAPPGSGLGASSSVMVAVIGLLKDYHRLALTDYEIAEMAYALEREDLGIKGGLQDQYAAAFGGFNYIEIERPRASSTRCASRPTWSTSSSTTCCSASPAARGARTGSSTTRPRASSGATTPRSTACGCRSAWPAR